MHWLEIHWVSWKNIIKKVQPDNKSLNIERELRQRYRECALFQKILHLVVLFGSVEII